MSAKTLRLGWIARPITLASRIDLTWVDVVVAVALTLDPVLEATLAQGLPDRLATAFFAVPFAAPTRFGAAGRRAP